MGYLEFKKNLFTKAYQQFIPILGEFELTARCNFACEMCYVHDSNLVAELSTDTWKRIFDEAIGAGLLYAVLTGGEVLKRSDFLELYSYLYDLGVRISIFTNGSLLSEDIVQALSIRPPEYVAITLYGASNHAYETVTKVSDGFDQVHQAIKLLKQYKINIRLRTIPLKSLFHELGNIIAYVKSEELVLQYFLYVGPTRLLCQTPKSLRLDPTELVIFEQTINHAFFNNNQDASSAVDHKSRCGAMKNGYFINYLGDMQPCALAYQPKLNIIDKSISESFQILKRQYETLTIRTECSNCSLLPKCMTCFARRLLEGTDQSCSTYLWQHALLRGKPNENI